MSVSTEAAERRSDSPLVGREQELGTLVEVWDRVRAGRRCELVTVVGAAGVGKSRLVAEFLASIDAALVRGRCLSYGEGITYWPVVEVLKQLEPRLTGLGPAPAADGALRGLVSNEGAVSTEEIGWAFRKLLEAVAAKQPLVAVFDDIQWAEEAFLDLLEQVVYLSEDAPILLCCMARPDLLDRRAGWAGVLQLEPLDADEAGDLIDARLGGQPLEPGVRHRIVAASGGNPLLRLTSLVRKELIRPDRAQLAGEDAFRFRHLLIRDAAYDGLPKSTRAELHERFGAWLEERGRALVEVDEIAGLPPRAGAPLSGRARAGRCSHASTWGARRRATFLRRSSREHARGLASRDWPARARSVATRDG